MIFVTVGTHTQPFNRLLKHLDSMPGNLKMFAQIGNSTYEPKNYPFTRFLSDREYHEKFRKCRLVITHAGAGSIIQALKNKKPLVIVPRLKEFGEHTNNHQLDLARALEARDLCKVVYNISNMGKIIKARQSKRLMQENRGVVEEIRGFFQKI